MWQSEAARRRRRWKLFELTRLRRAIIVVISARRPMRYQVPLVRREADLERTNADGGLVPTNRHRHAASCVANLPSSSVWPAEAEVTSQPDSGHRLDRGGQKFERNL